MSISEVKLPSNKKFGFFFTIVFLFFGCYFFLTERLITFYIFIILAGTFLTITIIKDSALFYLNKIWMRFGRFIGMIISPIVLAIIFFVIITPYALVMRLFGRDELRLKIRKEGSYWKPRKQTNSQTNFTQQF
tara:strand:- start:2110 stop:2508 length:399 start_codon:yes stop_codon:yes gene_type:complete